MLICINNVHVYFYHFCRFGIGRDFNDKVRLYDNRKKFGTNISHHYYENGINYIKHKESKDIEFKKKISELQSNSKLEMNRIKNLNEKNEQLKSQSKELKEHFDEKFDGLLKMLRGPKEESKDIEFKKNISELQYNSKLEMNRIKKHNEKNEQLKALSMELKEHFDEKFDGLLKMLRGFKEELFPSENIKKACKSTAKHHGVRDQNPRPRNRTRGKSIQIKRGEVQNLVQLFSQSLEEAP